MKRNAALKLSWLFLFALGWLACSALVGAQQAPGSASADSAPTARASRSGLYSVDSSGPDRDSMRGLEDRIGSDTSIPSGSINSRSIWMAGANNMSPAGASTWKGPQASFSGASASSWNAGARSFGLQRQQGGLWQELPGTEAQSQTRVANMPVTSAASNDSLTVSTLTPKGAALIKGAGLAAPYASHSGNRSGIGAIAGPFAAQRGVGSMKSQFGFKIGRSGKLGNRSGSPAATFGKPGSGTLNTPAIDDTLPLDEGLGSEKPLGSDEPDSTGAASH